jgi:two-component system, NarL family, nitrate/nitrite response regulator NarL
MSTSTVIVTPRVLLSEGIASLLRNTDYKVIASAARPAELLSSRRPTGRQTLAIVGTDPQNGNLDKVAESIQQLRSLLPNGKIVLVAQTDERIDPRRVLALSPDGCIFEIPSRDALIKALELVFLDQRVFVFDKPFATRAKENVEFTEPARDVQSDDPYRRGNNGYRLSPREAEILTSLAQGNSNKAIARLHHLSEATVKGHLKSILRKIKACNRTQAAIWAIQHGFQDHSSEHNGSAVADTPDLMPTAPRFFGEAQSPAG